VGELALTGLKFSAALPPRLAEATLARRPVDLDGAATLSLSPPPLPPPDPTTSRGHLTGRRIADRIQGLYETPV
jgi:hypothetical protein